MDLSTPEPLKQHGPLATPSLEHTKLYQGSLRVEIRDKITAARQAQKSWAVLSFKKRAAFIHKIQQYLLQHADTIAQQVSQATGKTRVDALVAEVIPCTLTCRWYSEHSEKVLAPQNLKPSAFLFLNKRSQLIHQALGVVGIISPWNYPLTIPFGEIIMGLMAGNAIMLKVSPETPSLGPLIAKILASASLPPGMFQLVEGPGDEVADALFFNKIDKIFFTGSVRVGKILMRQAADTLTPLSLELGGKDPMVVLADADLERASNGALWGAFQNAGQTCAGIERLYVHEDVYEEFLALLAKKTASLRHGPHSNEAADIGSMTVSRQLHAVHRHVEQALQQGARMVAQSQALEPLDQGLFYPATLLADVTHSMTVMKEETFGPVLAVMKFRRIEEALHLANDSMYALTASVWTKNLEAAKSMAKKLQAGVVTINDHLFTHALAEIPWGGPKESGLGRTHGALGLKEMSQTKVINWDIFPMKRNVYWYPYSLATYDSMKAAMHLNFSKNPLDICRHTAKLLPYYVKKVLRSWVV